MVYHHFLTISSLPGTIHLYLNMSVVESPGKLLKHLTNSEGDGVVSECADCFDDELVSLLLNHLPQLQPQSYFS